MLPILQREGANATHPRKVLIYHKHGNTELNLGTTKAFQIQWSQDYTHWKQLD